LLLANVNVIMFATCCRPSVCRLSVCRWYRSYTLLRR